MYRIYKIYRVYRVHKGFADYFKQTRYVCMIQYQNADTFPGKQTGQFSINILYLYQKYIILFKKLNSIVAIVVTLLLCK